MKIPSDATPGVKEALRDLDQRLGRTGVSRDLNLDLKGQRATNAGKATAMTDYTTLEQVLSIARETARAELVAQDQSKAVNAVIERLTVAVQNSAAPGSLAAIPAWLGNILVSIR